MKGICSFVVYIPSYIALMKFASIYWQMKRINCLYNAMMPDCVL